MTTVYPLIAMRARTRPDTIALIARDRTLNFRALIERVDRVAADFAQRGVARGDRIAILSENCIDYTVVQIACAKLGIIAACQNWRLADSELQHCIALVSPALLIASERYAALADRLATGVPIVSFGILGVDPAPDQACVAEPEDGLLIIYTSGTTGLPKAAVISHRAEIARMCALRLDLNIQSGDAYIAWPPMFHMGGTEHVLATLMSGDASIIVDGFDADAIIDALVAYRVGWLLLVPGTIEPLLARLLARRVLICGVRVVGCMADLVPSTVIAEVTLALNAPYLNSFGATETGMPPLSAALIPVGTMPTRFPKQLSVLTELQLVDASGAQVAYGETGEARVKGATLFSGYWNGNRVSIDAFREGWFPMGDLFRQTAEGYDFVGRSKYLIKSGGENIYPAEIERVLLADERVVDAIVVRQPDTRWGEIPVAVIARTNVSLDAATIAALCRADLAGYKQPRRICFVAAEMLPRSASGKIIREQIEAMLESGEICPETEYQG